ATTPARLAVIVVATLLGGMIAAVSVIGSSALEPRLTDAAGGALREAGIAGVDLRCDGREAVLVPAGAGGVALGEAHRAVAAGEGRASPGSICVSRDARPCCCPRGRTTSRSPRRSAWSRRSRAFAGR